ncbi:pyridoxamine 5'-phosphate oxidase family protein [Pectinatus haikarae]|uniref:Nitroimidazol reductase NimA-like FMN-containing flavoprotein (Pyridoxamine 5'-phosphate oxidase superfamily) n=1 Tax=Pectinatus haikarae TaxID=349096 RepID=A0ABT9Y677_9FIRM|nr:pyridoxamine 5'-phosphate oxidase family protein [Pectinatus haikarae]MDQ0203143.1 nitroimidazol reductase NimA-like FMN-containing flavoprotein (pyridoxamine 5'-phosphate oxidase superfamily) [Pectinatus haikarae]
MEEIRYQQRICRDEGRVTEFLTSMRVGTLALYSEGEPYAVPLNYLWTEGKLYFHGLASGRKEKILQENPQICFNVHKEYGTVKDDMPCHADTAYFSVTMFGKAVPVDDAEEKAAAMQAFVEKYMPGYYKKPLTAELMRNYKSGHDGRTVQVYKIVPETITAKENSATKEELFNK